MSAPDRRFGKQHRLCGKKRIDRLFAQGQSFFAYPFRCVWMVVGEAAAETREGLSESPCAQMLVSVSKKNHKRAVARNTLKRRTREAYRLNRRDDLALADGRRLAVAFLYTSKEILDYAVIEHGVVKALAEIHKRLAPGVGAPVHAAD